LKNKELIKRVFYNTSSNKENMENKPIIEYENVYDNYKYCVVFNPRGYRCGYVEIPVWHKMYGYQHSLIPIKCHGGLTYSKDYLLDKKDNTWWIGFDCSHSDDKNDIESQKKYFGNNERDPYFDMLNFLTGNYDNGFGTIKTLDFCVNECKNIIDQLNNLS
jgi:hypothetical protein